MQIRLINTHEYESWKFCWLSKFRRTFVRTFFCFFVHTGSVRHPDVDLWLYSQSKQQTSRLKIQQGHQPAGQDVILSLWWSKCLLSWGFSESPSARWNRGNSATQKNFKATIICPRTPVSQTFLHTYKSFVSFHAVGEQQREYSMMTHWHMISDLVKPLMSNNNNNQGLVFIPPTILEKKKSFYWFGNSVHFKHPIFCNHAGLSVWTLQHVHKTHLWTSRKCPDCVLVQGHPSILLPLCSTY